MSGGIGAVSAGVAGWLIIAAVLLLVVLGGWKLVKLLILALKG